MTAVLDRTKRGTDQNVSTTAPPGRDAAPKGIRLYAGSAGVIQVVDGYAPFGTRVGTSFTIVDSRSFKIGASWATPKVPAPTVQPRPATLKLSSSEQVHEVLAALSLNKTQLADVLRVSRPTLYDWLEGKEPNVANAQRLRLLVKLLSMAGVSAAAALSPRFLREALEPGELSLLEMLKADTLDEGRIAKALAEAKALERQVEEARLAREARLRALGFEEPTAEQRKANLALNVALSEWPKD